MKREVVEEESERVFQ